MDTNSERKKILIEALGLRGENYESALAALDAYDEKKREEKSGPNFARIAQDASLVSHGEYLIKGASWGKAFFDYFQTQAQQELRLKEVCKKIQSYSPPPPLRLLSDLADAILGNK